MLDTTRGALFPDRAIGPVEQRIQDGLDAGSLRSDAVLEALPQGLVVRDSAGRTLYCNPAAVEMLGLASRHDLLDVPLEDLPELRVERDAWLRLVSGEGRQEELDRACAGRGAVGEGRSAAAVRGRGGEPLELLVLEDVSLPRWERDRERFVAEAADELSRSLDMETSLRNMARLAVPRLADWCAIEVRRGSGSLVRRAIAHSDPDRERWAGEDPRRFPSAATAPGLGGLEAAGLVGELSAWIAEEARADERRLAGLAMLELKSAAVVPLRARGRLLGAMTLATAESGRVYSPADLELLERLARRYALALDNARLFREQQRTAARLQSSLRPGRLPDVPRLDVAAHYQPVGDGAQAGGDFYDLFPGGHGSWVAVLGDVSGKGIDAAASSALMRHTLRAAASGHGRLPRALALADEILHAEDEDRLCSAVLVRAAVSLGRARLKLANAGHPPPYGAAGRRLRGVAEDPRLDTGRLHQPADAGDRPRPRARRRTRPVHRRRDRGAPRGRAVRRSAPDSDPAAARGRVRRDDHRRGAAGAGSARRTARRRRPAGDRRPQGPLMKAWATAFAVLAAAGVGVHLGFALSGHAGGAPVEDWLYGALFAATSASCAGRAVRSPSERVPWTLAAVGVATWLAAEVVYRATESDPTAVYPPATRVLLLLSFTLAATTIALLSRRRVREVEPRLLLDGLIGGLAVAAVAAIPLFGEETTPVSQATPPALFLLADLAILAFVVVVTGLTGWRPGRGWALIAGGIVLNTIGNCALVVESTQRDLRARRGRRLAVRGQRPDPRRGRLPPARACGGGPGGPPPPVLARGVRAGGCGGAHRGGGRGHQPGRGRPRRGHPRRAGGPHAARLP